VKAPYPPALGIWRTGNLGVSKEEDEEGGVDDEEEEAVMSRVILNFRRRGPARPAITALP
jgi:hypothetical protein